MTYMENLINKAKTEKSKIDYSSSGKVSDSNTEKVIKELSRDAKTSEENAFKGMAVLAQIGGTSNRANGQTLFVEIEGNKITLDQVKRALKLHTSQKFRRFAKTHAQSIYHIIKDMNLPGNLYKKIVQKKGTEFKDEEIPWVSDFQSENNHCPEDVRQALREYYAEFVDTNTKR